MKTLKKGIIKVINRDSKFDEFSIGLSGQSAPKKKQKGPKVSKRDQKLESTPILNLDLTIIKKIKDVGLNPPVKKDEVPSFLNQVAKLHAEYKLAQENKKKGIVSAPIKTQAKPHVEEVKVKEIPATRFVETPKAEVTETVTKPDSPKATKYEAKITKHESPKVEEPVEEEVIEEPIVEAKTTVHVSPPKNVIHKKEEVDQGEDEYEEVEITEEVEEIEEVVEAPKK